MEEKISVIIPVYNVEKYLNQCIQSVINQTYSCLEIILIDDGSVDGSGSICDEWAKGDSRIIVIHKKNGGLSDTRNKGITIATGAYLFFLDSDDFIASNALGRLYWIIKKTNSDISMCNFIYTDEEGVILRNQEKGPIEEDTLSGEQVLKEKMFAPQYWQWVIMCNKLYKKSIFDNICLPVGKMHEDEYVVHDIFFQSKRVACIADILYFYRQRNNSITNSSFSIRNLDIVEAYLNRALFYKSINWQKEAEKTLVQTFRFFQDGYESINQNYSIKKKMRKLSKRYNETYFKICSIKSINAYSVKGFFFCISKKLYIILRLVLKK